MLCLSELVKFSEKSVYKKNVVRACLGNLTTFARKEHFKATW